MNIQNVIAYEGKVVILPNGKAIIPTGGRTYEDYEGAYEVNPLVTTQILETYDKHMIDDLTINMIQTRETVNPSGGVTFEILG